MTTAPYNGRPPFVRDSDTSEQAADSVEGSTATWRARVLALVRGSEPGITCDEAEVVLDQRHQNVSARFRELVLTGLIEDSGQRRATRSGRNARVYRATPQTSSR